VHIPSDRLRIPSPTPEDLHMLDAFVEEGIDMVALSFVRSAHDVRRVGVEPHPRGPLVVAKIETRAAVDNLDSIIEASGAVMIARGDLGAEMPIEELPHLQKRILERCITLGRPAITATQMLESMVTAPSPTRAEASDIANAVFDGSSAVMLSGESAIGPRPRERRGHHGPHRGPRRRRVRLRRLGRHGCTRSPPPCSPTSTTPSPTP
jgi:pyruvate kinase